MKPLKERLMEKGWTKEEAENTHDLLYAEEKQVKHIDYTKSSNTLVYWTVLLVLVICNFLVSFVLIPFLLVLKALQVEIIVMALGFILGLFFNMLIMDLEHVHTKHHYAAMLLIPTIALLNMLLMVTVANSLADIAQLPRHENPFMVSLFYILAFIAPYSFSLIKNKIKGTGQKIIESSQKVYK